MVPNTSDKYLSLSTVDIRNTNKHSSTNDSGLKTSIRNLEGVQASKLFDIVERGVSEISIRTRGSIPERWSRRKILNLNMPRDALLHHVD